jgi:predicted Zn-dependent protease
MAFCIVSLQTTKTDQGMDPLFAARTAFYIGNYDKVMNEQSSANDEDEAIYLRARTLLALHKTREAEALAKQASPDLSRALVALIHHKNSTNEVAESLANTNNDYGKIVSSLLYCHRNAHEEAYKVVRTCTHPEAQFHLIELLLYVNRLDLAEESLKHMKQDHGESVLTQLADAHFQMAKGKPKDALYTFEELVEVYGATTRLSLCQATCHLLLGDIERAEQLVGEAETLHSSEVPSSEILALKATILARMNQPDYTNMLDQLQQLRPNHPMVIRLEEGNNDFARLAEQFAQ